MDIGHAVILVLIVLVGLVVLALLIVVGLGIGFYISGAPERSATDWRALRERHRRERRRRKP